MDKEDYISTLPQAEQKALSVCGIYKARQLRSISFTTLYSDMLQAAEYFPDDIKLISKERLAEICEHAGMLPEEEKPGQPETQPQQQIETVDTDFERTLPPLERKHGTRHRSPHKTDSNTIDLTKVKPDNSGKKGADKSGAICNTHPFRTLFSALVQVWLVCSMVLFVITATRLILGMEKGVTFNHLIILFLSGVLPYILYTRKTKCPVCNMSLFTLQNYTRNKYAHKLPVLGYSVATALHIIFFFWFRCPACGTAQKLFKRKRR